VQRNEKPSGEKRLTRWAKIFVEAQTTQLTTKEMPMDLFVKGHAPACAYCQHVERQGNILQCPKHGVVLSTQKCRSFVYDPLKRVPPKPAVLKTDYENDEFKV